MELPRQIDSDEPPVVLGCSPFVASRQFAERRREYETRFSGHPEAVMQVWTAFAQAGGTTLHLVDDEELWRAFERWHPRWPHMAVWLTVASADSARWCARLASRGGGRVFRHARAVDAGDDLRPFFEAAAAHGLKPGCVTHRPGHYLLSLENRAPGASPNLPLLVPFNASGFCMDMAPDELHEHLRGRPGETFAMMPLGAGRIPFADGIAFTALHFRSQVVGTGNPQHAKALAETVPLIVALREARAFRRRANPHVDVSESEGDVVFLVDHLGLRLRDAAARLWVRLSDPASLKELVGWAAEESGQNPARLLPPIAGCLLTLLRWRLIDAEQ